MPNILNKSGKAMAQGTIVNVAPNIITDIATGPDPDSLYCFVWGTPRYSWRLFSLSQESFTLTFDFAPYFQGSKCQAAVFSQDWSRFYATITDNYFDEPGTVNVYDFTTFGRPQLLFNYDDPVSAYAFYPTPNPHRLIMRAGGFGKHRPAIIDISTSQLIGEYDMRSSFSSVNYLSNGNIVCMTERRTGAVDELTPPEPHSYEVECVVRQGNDLVELSPTLQFIRIIGENNMFEGKYTSRTKMKVINNGQWIILTGFSDGICTDPNYAYNNPPHPHDKWFSGLIQLDYTTGNVIHHWYEDGGGLDGGVKSFDVTANSMKVIAKAGPETFDQNGVGIENPYVYIFNLQNGTVTKADWGLEGDSDIEIVDSMNRVYCTLPSQQAIAWFPLP